MNKEEIVKCLLERQKDIKVDKVQVQEIEPFSWMDETIKEHLSNILTEEQMNAMDKCARANIEGRRIMTQAIRKALNKNLNDCEG